MISFYERTLRKMIDKGMVSTNDRILIVAGGRNDRDIFMRLGFQDVLISNLDYHAGETNYDPYKWVRQDAEALTFSSNSFDCAFVHNGLHHCASPHRGLCEMLRVSRKGIGVFEARDSALMRLSQAIGLVPHYELEPALLSGGEVGGQRNGPIPNYVYRWTEREVRKTVNSFLPQYRHEFTFYYGMRAPMQRLRMSTSLVKRCVCAGFSCIAPLVERVLPQQCNEFGFFVSKEGPLQSWLVSHPETGKISVDLANMRKEYNPDRYDRRA